MKGLYVLKEKRIYKRELPLWGSLLAAVLLAGCITLLALWCQPNALRTVLAGFKAQPLLIVLNALPIGLLLLAFAFLFRNVFYSGALVNFFVCALSLANRVKIEVRDEPVFPRDFSLLREVGSAIQSFDIRYPVKAIAVVVLTIATMYPYLRHRIPEIQAENLTLESARKNAQHATVKSQSAVGESRDSIGSQAADSMTDSPADSRDSQAGEVQDPAADK